jgi:hypothetical protein
MNKNHLLAGSVSTNPILGLLGLLLILTRRVARYAGLPRYLLPRLSASWTGSVRDVHGISPQMGQFAQCTGLLVRRFPQQNVQLAL